VDGSAASVTGSDFSAGQNHASHQAAKPKENVFRFPVQGPIGTLKPRAATECRPYRIR